MFGGEELHLDLEMVEMELELEMVEMVMDNQIHNGQQVYNGDAGATNNFEQITVSIESNAQLHIPCICTVMINQVCN